MRGSAGVRQAAAQTAATLRLVHTYERKAKEAGIKRARALIAADYEEAERLQAMKEHYEYRARKILALLRN